MKGAGDDGCQNRANRQPTHDAPGHETRDVSIVGLVLSAVALAAALLMVFWALVGFLDHLQSKQRQREPSLSPLAAPQRPSPPLLQANPTDDLQAIRERDQRRLRAYAWVDREQRVIQIPIERAMHLIAERGLPRTEEPAAPAESAGETTKSPARQLP